MNRLLLFFLIAGHAAVFSSCRRGGPAASSGKSGSDSVAAEKPAVKPPVMRPEFARWPGDYWTAKARLNLETGGTSLPVSLTMRAVRGESLWFSASAMGLMEICRGLVQGDSLVVWDKFRNQCFVAHDQGPGGSLPFSVGVKQLQTMLMGGVFWDSLSVSSKRSAGDTIFYQGSQAGTSWLAAVAGPDRLLGADVRIPDFGQSVQTTNGDFRDVRGFPVAFRKEIVSTVESNGKTSVTRMTLQFSRFEFVEARPETTLELPSGCERKPLSGP
jgi:hypothetical protein